MAQTRVEEHDAVEVGVKRLEVLRLVHGVEIVDVRADLHLATQAVLHNGAEGILRRALWQRELRVAVGHALGTDEDEVQQSAGKIPIAVNRRLSFEADRAK